MNDNTIENDNAIENDKTVKKDKKMVKDKTTKKELPGPKIDGLDRDLQAFRFLVAIGRGLHRCGAPVHRLERALEEISKALGLQASFLATPTSLMTTAELHDDQKTHLARQAAGAVELGKLSQLDGLAQQAIAGEVGIGEATVEVGHILGQPDRYPPILRVLAFALSSGGFACFLGARWAEVGAAAIAGLLIGTLALVFGEGRRGSDLFEPGAAFSLAFLVPFFSLWAQVSVPLVVLAGLIVLVPGLTFTQAVTELAQRSLVSGTSRLFGAIMVFMLLAFGSIMGTTLAKSALGTWPNPTVVVSLPLVVLLAAVIVTSMSFVVMFRAEPRDFLPIVGCGLVTFLAARAALWAFDGLDSAPLFAAFSGAVAAGLFSNVFARVFHRPALVPRVPAMMQLVPGSLGFRAVSLFSANDTAGGLELVTMAGFIAVAIASGLFLANALLQPRQRL